MAHPYFDLPLPIASGHRGCAGEVAENTLRSFERALERGAGILESDVHLTCDGVAVLIHDDSVDRNELADERMFFGFFHDLEAATSMFDALETMHPLGQIDTLNFMFMGMATSS